MEELFEFLFGASGRINRAKYWRSVLIFIVAGLMTAVILLTAAGIAAPFFIIMVVLVLIPLLLWGISVTTERLRHRQRDIEQRHLDMLATAEPIAGQQRQQDCIAG
jgi:uncharacterized membrane protein YhaH (DUF805 family)